MKLINILLSLRKRQVLTCGRSARVLERQSSDKNVSNARRPPSECEGAIATCIDCKGRKMQELRRQLAQARTALAAKEVERANVAAMLANLAAALAAR